MWAGVAQWLQDRASICDRVGCFFSSPRLGIQKKCVQKKVLRFSLLSRAVSDSVRSVPHSGFCNCCVKLYVITWQRYTVNLVVCIIYPMAVSLTWVTLVDLLSEYCTRYCLLEWQLILSNRPTRLVSINFTWWRQQIFSFRNFVCTKYVSGNGQSSKRHSLN